MFLFRPSNNNQRYAFVPLLDQSVDDDDDEVDDEDEEKGGKIINKKKESVFVYTFSKFNWESSSSLKK